MLTVIKEVVYTCDVSVNGEKIEQAKVMEYLGTLFNDERKYEEVIENSIGAASKVIGAMRSEIRELRKGLVNRVFNVMVVTLLYGCGTWTIK